MKKLFKIALITTLLSASSVSMAQEAGTVDVTLSPVYSALGTVQTAIETVVSPFVSSSATTLAAARMEMEAVQEDAINYLAGDEQTDMLAEVIFLLRDNTNGELDQATDEEIALTMLEALN